MNRDFDIIKRLIRQIDDSDDSISLIDTLKLYRSIHETAHSRILYHLLRNSSNNYRFWELFISQLGIGSFTVTQDSFTREDHNIDILIKDDNKTEAIIIENKANNAKDQPRQILTYIQHVKDLGYVEDNIYIIYLTRKKYDSHPSEDSLPSEIMNRFQNRGHYFKISYERDIIRWLEECEKENDPSDLYHSAIKQYRKYLNNLFTPNMNINRIIEEQLSLSDKSASYKYNEISRFTENLRELERHLSSYKQTFINDAFKESDIETQSDSTYIYFKGPVNYNNAYIYLKGIFCYEKDSHGDGIWFGLELNKNSKEFELWESSDIRYDVDALKEYIKEKVSRISYKQKIREKDLGFDKNTIGCYIEETDNVFCWKYCFDHDMALLEIKSYLKTLSEVQGI